MKHHMKRLLMFVLTVMMIGFIPIHSEETGSITLDLKYVDDTDVIPISGAEISIYKVWTYDANKKVVMASPFTYANASSINGETKADEIQKLTDSFVKQKGSAIPVATNTSDGTGNVVFSDLELGLYLVCQNEPVTIDGKKYFMAPFVITVPYRQEGEEDFQNDPVAVNEEHDEAILEYNLRAAPKFMIPSEFSVLKIDEKTKDVLPGATLVITDTNGNVVNDIYGNRCEWVTGEEKKEFFLKPGDYILKETKVPAGYVKAADIRFRVEDDYTITLIDKNGNEIGEAADNTILMEDPIAPPPSTTPPTTTTPPKSTPPFTPPNTGDHFNITFYGGMFIGAVVLIAILLNQIKKSHTS